MCWVLHGSIASIEQESEVGGDFTFLTNMEQSNKTSNNPYNNKEKVSQIDRQADDLMKQVAAEMGLINSDDLMTDTAGKEGKKFFPLVFSLFMFILFGNLFGMIPYSFTFTSHIIVTFGLALGVFIFVTLLGFVKHGVKFFSFFVIPGLPIYMLPLLIPIEVISYLSRPISLAVRLFANMLAGHTLLKVFAGFVSALGFFGILPLVFIVALTGLEILIAFLQAYVFAILTCLYINDALHLH
jgi:F-type H+-transporting ATPase subunit a